MIWLTIEVLPAVHRFALMLRREASKDNQYRHRSSSRFYFEGAATAPQGSFSAGFHIYLTL